MRRWSESSRRDAVLAAVVVVLFGAVAARFPAFAAPANVAQLLDDSAILILLALGQMLVILTRGIDLSVAANLAFTGMVAALVNSAWPGIGIGVLLLLSAALGACLGAVNGILIWKLRLPPIVITLGTMSIYRGCIYVLSHGTWVNENEMTAAFVDFVRREWLGLSTLAWSAILVSVVFFVSLRSLRAARNFYVVGGNPHAAQFAGIEPGRVQFWSYVISGAIAGLCGYLWVARFAVAYTDVALGFELQVIAACLVGGVAIAGGTGTVVGVVLGCLFLGVIKNALPLVGVSAFWQMFINGVVILVAVVLSVSREQRRTILENAA
ncbi:MAG TPA: ABC transporter permease [Steroidobacteraceae bacterium]|nr:ABC transporter permease [Steroidobacteraceae bacterium]